jgi:ribonuclease-3 family protein
MSREQDDRERLAACALHGGRADAFSAKGEPDDALCESCVQPAEAPEGKDEVLRMNVTALAWIGDAVYETYVRKYIIDTGCARADRLHRAAVRFVKARAQAGVMRALEGDLPEDEQALVRRSRNKKSASKPKNADPMDYKWSTAFEALIGYYYLTGQTGKLEETVLFALNRIEFGGA